MPAFGKTSTQRLATCHPSLQKVFNEVIKTFDCSIICGHRDEKTQNEYYEKSTEENSSKVLISKLKYPNSKHNANPSLAVDVAPYPIDWDDTKRFYLFAGYVLATANQLGIKLRWGGDWDSDNQVNDQSFNDLVHFEIVN